MLFDDGVSEEYKRALKSLETAYEELGVPWPFDEAGDLGVLRRIKTKYPTIDVGDLVDSFLVWCADAHPWKNEKGKPVTIRWRSRLWTRANNDIRYGKVKARRRQKHSTHFAAPVRNEESTVLDEW